MRTNVQRSEDGVWYIKLERVLLASKEVELPLHRIHDFSNPTFHSEIAHEGRIFVSSLYRMQVFGHIRLKESEIWLTEYPGAAIENIVSVLGDAVSACLSEAISKLANDDKNVQNEINLAAQAAQHAAWSRSTRKAPGASGRSLV